MYETVSITSLYSTFCFISDLSEYTPYVRESKMYLGFRPPSSGAASSQILMWFTYVSSTPLAFRLEKTEEIIRARTSLSDMRLVGKDHWSRLRLLGSWCYPSRAFLMSLVAMCFTICPCYAKPLTTINGNNLSKYGDPVTPPVYINLEKMKAEMQFRQGRQIAIWLGVRIHTDLINYNHYVLVCSNGKGS